MKNLLIVLLLAAAVALGAVCMHQHKQMTQIQAQPALTESQTPPAEARAPGAVEASENTPVTRTTPTETPSAVAEQRAQIKELQQALADAKTNASGQGLGALFKDPEMREMIKAQQKAVMVPMMEKQYAALFQQLKLTPAQNSSVKELLEKKMLVAGDLGLSMFASGNDASKSADLARQIKTETDGFDEQIKETLGAANYETFKSYEKSIPDRLEVGLIRDQMAGTSTALSSAQEEQLIQAMQEQRSGFKWTAGYSNGDPSGADIGKIFSEEGLNQMTQQKELFDQQFLARAMPVLTQEQFAAFEKAQTAQREMSLNTMKLAAKMLGPKAQ